jgi:hypothetical protein
MLQSASSSSLSSFKSCLYTGTVIPCGRPRTSPTTLRRKSRCLRAAYRTQGCYDEPQRRAHTTSSRLQMCWLMGPFAYLLSLVRDVVHNERSATRLQIQAVALPTTKRTDTTARQERLRIQSILDYDSQLASILAAICVGTWAQAPRDADCHGRW